MPQSPASAPCYTLSSPEEGEACLPLCPTPRPAGAAEWRYLIALDYDGTLKPDREHAPAPAFFEYILRLRAQGVCWGINTGRSLQKLAPELAQFPLQPDFVCTCERYVYTANPQGKLTPAARHNAHCHRANHRLRTSILPAWQQALSALRRACQECKWELAADDPLSIEAEDSATMDRLMPHLAPMAQGQVGIQRAGRFMRLCDARFSKGSALRYVQQQLEVPEPRLCIMGDGHNDLDAFRHFPKAFCAAPAKAHPDVIHWLREHGGYISPEPGVLDALKYWARQHRLLPA